MELWVVTAVPSSTLVSLETARQVTYSTKWWAPETIWAISPQVGKPKCLYEKKLSRLTGLPYLLRRDDSPTRVVLPPRDEFAFSCKQLVEFFKEISEKLAQPASSGTMLERLAAAWVRFFFRIENTHSLPAHHNTNNNTLKHTQNICSHRMLKDPTI